jgi:hypothetical protein
MDPPDWEYVGKGVDSPENHTVQEGALCGSGQTLLVKPQRVRYKLEPLKSLVVISYRTPQKVCKGIPSDQRMPSYQG